MDSTFDNKDSPPIAPHAFMVFMGITAGGITGLMASVNLSGGDAVYSGAGLVAGVVLGLVVALAGLDLADGTPGRSRADKAGSWLVRLLIVLAISILLFDRVQVEIARQKVKAEAKRTEQIKP